MSDAVKPSHEFEPIPEIMVHEATALERAEQHLRELAMAVLVEDNDGRRLQLWRQVDEALDTRQMLRGEQ